jgi:hypothetical protein
MAQIYEEVIIIKLSKLIKSDSVPTAIIANDEYVTALARIAEELAGAGVVVEVEKA